MRGTSRVFVVFAVAAAGVLQAGTADAGWNGGVYYPACQRAVVPPAAAVVPAPVGIQLFDVRLVDAGFPEKQLGPRFRVFFRNLGPAVTAPFDVILAAGINDQFVAELPQLRQRVSPMAPGQSLSIDLRLPLEVLSLPHPEQPQPVPFTTLFVLVAEQQDLLGNAKLKQLVALPRANILPVDLDILPPADNSVASGAIISLAGEGFGLQPGQVRMRIGGLELLGAIVAWGPLGIQVKLPELALAAPALGELLVIRHDGQQAPILPIRVMPVQAVVATQAVAVAQPAAAGVAVPAATGAAPAAAAVPAAPVAPAAPAAPGAPVAPAAPAAPAAAVPAAPVGGVPVAAGAPAASTVPAAAPAGAPSPASAPALAPVPGPGPAPNGATVAAPVDPATIQGPAPLAPAAGPAPGGQPSGNLPQGAQFAPPPAGAVPPAGPENGPQQPSGPINGPAAAGPQGPMAGNPQQGPPGGFPANGQFSAAPSLGGAGLLARPAN